MCLLEVGGGGAVGGGQVYFLQLDLDGNHKKFKNHQNKKPQGHAQVRYE